MVYLTASECVPSIQPYRAVTCTGNLYNSWALVSMWHSLLEERGVKLFEYSTYVYCLLHWSWELSSHTKMVTARARWSAPLALAWWLMAAGGKSQEKSHVCSPKSMSPRLKTWKSDTQRQAWDSTRHCYPASRRNLHSYVRWNGIPLVLRRAANIHPSEQRLFAQEQCKRSLIYFEFGGKQDIIGHQVDIRMFGMKKNTGTFEVICAV